MLENGELVTSGLGVVTDGDHRCHVIAYELVRALDATGHSALIIEEVEFHLVAVDAVGKLGVKGL